MSKLAESEACCGKHMKFAYDTDVQKVDPEQLAKVVMKLYSCSSRSNNMTTEQLNLLFKTLADQPEPQIQSLDLFQNDLSECDIDNMSRAVSKINTVNLAYTQLTSDQVNALLDLIANSNDHKLKHLSLEGNILSFVPGHTVATAVCTLKLQR